ncbi:DUF3006 domain-containing protein [Natronomonas gomsonensis]|jgi:hypothetical protein|uniref:DUF3006 domain-containing protein n=1 Tax=Natronomonas gomsonensis TaxID=1046043 RepID=UPI0020CA581C|nr:DUF3006 domain-containing protein [Natronomonas gomsonensis]MCY4729807.1 DUF3006 domain-containing protein [Natronomonas gomsonensis]
MISDGRYVAVVDRIEDGVAAVIPEVDGVGEELLVDPEALPERARHADAVLDVVVADGELSEATYDAEETERRKETAQSRFDKLSKRPPKDEEDDEE